MNRLLSGLFVFIFTLMALSVNAQEKKNIRIVPYVQTDSLHYKTDSVSQKDLYDVLKSVIHKGSKKIRKDSITSKPVYSYIPAIGYTLSSGLALSLSGNVAFRTAPGARESTITASAAYTQKNQFTIPIESNIWSKTGDYLFVGDYRFYRYPQITYGLGSNSNINNQDQMKFNYIRFYETIYKHFTGNLYLGGGYIIDYHANITDQGNLNGTPSDYRAYMPMPQTHSISSGITLNEFFDNRDNPIYPTKGFYTALQYRDSYRFLGSTSGWRSLIIDVRKYYKFPESSDNVLALWSYDWLVLSGAPPYLDLPSTSWDPYSSTGRGYIQGRFRGAQMMYLESEYRYKISANGLFGGVIFGNVESLSAKPGTGLQRIQPGFGPGLRIKLNKISKTNICIDYGFGNEGSRGVFVNVGELF